MGFTLIEIIMAIVVVGALAGGVMVFVTQGVDIWNFVTFRNDESAQARLALDRMVKEIRQVYDKASVTTASADDFNFVSYYNNTTYNVEFVKSGSNLMRNSDVLCDNVSSLQFQYYDINNNLLSTPLVLPDETDIRRIKITLTVTSGDQSITLKSQVYPRNF